MEAGGVTGPVGASKVDGQNVRFHRVWEAIFNAGRLSMEIARRRDDADIARVAGAVGAARGGVR